MAVAVAVAVAVAPLLLYFLGQDSWDPHVVALHQSYRLNAACLDLKNPSLEQGASPSMA